LFAQTPNTRGSGFGRFAEAKAATAHEPKKKATARRTLGKKKIDKIIKDRGKEERRVVFQPRISIPDYVLLIQGIEFLDCGTGPL